MQILRSAPPLLRFAARPRAAFSLVELLTVIAVVAILVALFVGIVGRVRESARSARCTSNLRQLHQAAMLYGNDHRGIIPAGSELRVGPAAPSGNHQRLETRLRPYLAAVHNQRADRGSVFDCPSAELRPEHERSTIHGFGVVNSANGTGGRGRTFLQFADPKRPFFADKRVYDTSGNPDGNDYVDRNNLEYRHGGKSRANVVFFDGHVESIGSARAAVLQWYP